ncbi:unnamed protein product [Owenia fusiformis]|uniref:Uncharacterized protein n=1 Tax=Owenia fusiformis TaxID=6347 RepID=A0A8J1UT12_OWEFU|nr:unnamed protein product [Owenia fusiformis]
MAYHKPTFISLTLLIYFAILDLMCLVPIPPILFWHLFCAVFGFFLTNPSNSKPKGQSKLPEPILPFWAFFKFRTNKHHSRSVRPIPLRKCIVRMNLNRIMRLNQWKSKIKIPPKQDKSDSITCDSKPRVGLLFTLVKHTKLWILRLIDTFREIICSPSAVFYLALDVLILGLRQYINRDIDDTKELLKYKCSSFEHFLSTILIWILFVTEYFGMPRELQVITILILFCVILYRAVLQTFHTEMMCLFFTIALNWVCQNESYDTMSLFFDTILIVFISINTFYTQRKKICLFCKKSPGATFENKTSTCSTINYDKNVEAFVRKHSQSVLDDNLVESDQDSIDINQTINRNITNTGGSRCCILHCTNEGSRTLKTLNGLYEIDIDQNFTTDDAGYACSKCESYFLELIKTSNKLDSLIDDLSVPLKEQCSISKMSHSSGAEINDMPSPEKAQQTSFEQQSVDKPLFVTQSNDPNSTSYQSKSETGICEKLLSLRIESATSSLRKDYVLTELSGIF